MIEIRLSMDKALTTADLGWLIDAVNGASGHSGQVHPIEIDRGSIIVRVPSGEDED